MPSGRTQYRPPHRQTLLSGTPQFWTKLLLVLVENHDFFGLLTSIKRGKAYIAIYGCRICTRVAVPSVWECIAAASQRVSHSPRTGLML